LNINFIFFSISNNFETFHRKREIEAIADNKAKGNVKVIYFNAPQFFLKKLFSLASKRDKSSHPNIIICELYTLLPISWVVKSRLLVYLFVTIPITLQTLYTKGRYLTSPNCISWFYKPDQYLYLKSLTPYIYLHYDNYQGDKTYYFSEDKKFNAILKKCISNSMLTLVSSFRLFEKYKNINPRKVFYYPNAISRSLIQPHFVDIKKKNEIVIGFIGQLDQTFDSVLLEKIASKFHDYKIKLIGEVKNEMVMDVADKYGNIDLLGYMEYENLSEEIKSFTIGICPYKATDFNQYRNPLKISEYFSYGIPVVSVKCDIDKKYEGLLGVASNHHEFLKLITVELDSNSQDKRSNRKKLIEDNCWDNRASFVINEIRKSIKIK